jgi:hypothetical protein
MQAGAADSELFQEGSRTMQGPVTQPLVASIQVEASAFDLSDGCRSAVECLVAVARHHGIETSGAVAGEASNVSADAFNQTAAGGVESWYYLVRIKLTDTRLRHLPPPTRLLPGMTQSREIVTGRRTVISYFRYPVIRVLDESLRER